MLHWRQQSEAHHSATTESAEKQVQADRFEHKLGT